MADSAKGQVLAPPPKLARDLRSRLLGEYGILIIVVVMAAALSFLQPQYFLSAQNVTNIVRQIGMNALLALGMGSLFWMAAVAAVILVEKTTSIGARAPAPVAFALVAAAVWVVAL